VGGWKEGEEVPCLCVEMLARLRGRRRRILCWALTRSFMVCLPTVLIMWMRSWRMKTRSRAEIMLGDDASWDQRRGM